MTKGIYARNAKGVQHKKINVIYYTNRTKNENHMTISIYTEKSTF